MEVRKNDWKVGVVGGGAAGMMAAITAARAGAKVTILEAGDRLGQKILSTGNGKCNLGNLDLNLSNYHGSCEFLRECFQQFGTKDTVRFFEEIGLYVKEKNGLLYPLCEQASAVLDVLRFEVAAREIRVLTGFKIHEVKVTEKGILAVGDERREKFDALILSTGGKAMPKTGSDGSGYELAKKLGHAVTPVVPALTALKCKGDFFKSIAGVRTDAGIELLDKNGKVIDTDRGELQLTDYGISGIPVFQISRTALYEIKRNQVANICIDFLPSLGSDEESLRKIARERKRLCKGRTAEECMTGIMPKKIMALLLKRANVRLTDPAEAMSEKTILGILKDAKRFMVCAVDSQGFQNCQVCAGGVDFGEVDRNLESKKWKNLFFAGELLDVDGKCGGYNLQWAWTSGYLAGSAAAERRGNNS